MNIPEQFLGVQPQSEGYGFGQNMISAPTEPTWMVRVFGETKEFSSLSAAEAYERDADRRYAHGFTSISGPELTDEQKDDLRSRERMEANPTECLTYALAQYLRGIGQPISISDLFQAAFDLGFDTSTVYREFERSVKTLAHVGYVIAPRAEAASAE